MAPINIVDVLRHARHEADRNAAVLDHISASFLSSPMHMPQQSHQTFPFSAGSTSAGISHLAPNSSCNTIHGKPQELKEDLRTYAPHNGKTSHRIERPSPTPPRSASPISKYIMSALFSALDADDPQVQFRQRPNYVFIDHDREHDFLYGLVLPVIARLLAVSYPGLLCVVQLPKPDAVPEWAAPSSSDVSNGSKSGERTTPHDSNRTTPSDEDAVPRKSQSPEAPSMTAKLIHHADYVLSGAGASADRGNIENDVAEKSDLEGSPSPNSFNKDHRVLPFICNGFEVLTGKMPPPRYNMGSFTLASVGWEKAGIVSPEYSSKGVTMSFSNGMMMATEGIVVTFSNGSMCLLTLQDPLILLDTMKMSDATPVLMFLFSQEDLCGLGNVLSQDPSTLNPDAARVRRFAERQNLFFVEIGCASEGPSGGASTDRPGEKSSSSKSLSPGSSLGTKPTCSTPSMSTKSASVGSSLKTKSSTSVGSSLGSILTLPSTENAAITSRAPKNTPRCPALNITAVPRAVPLFVNTINQTFIDPPFYDVPENVYETELINGRYREVPHEPIHGERDTPLSESKGSRATSVNPNKKRKVKNGRTSISRGEAKTEADNARTANVSEHTGLARSTFRDNGQHPDTAATAPDPCNINDGSRKHELPDPLHSSPLVGQQVPIIHDEVRNQRLPSIFNTFDQGQGHLYHCGSQPPSAAQISQPLTGPRTVIHETAVSLNEAHPGYYHPMQSRPHTSNGYYHHHPYRSQYAEHPYYSMQIANSMVHSTGRSQNGDQWHHGVPAVLDQTSILPPPHLTDARRDMPVHFSSHHAGANGQYPSHYYSYPSHHGYLRGTQPKRPNMNMLPDRRDPAFSPHDTNASKNSGLEAENAVPTADASRKRPRVSKSARKRAATVPSQTDRDQQAKYAKIQNNGAQPVKPSSQQNSPQSADKENVLRALIQMRQGVPIDESREPEAKKTRSTSSAQARENETDHAIPSEQQISKLSWKRPNESLEAYNDASRDEGQTTRQLPLSKEEEDPNERGENSETSSTASTNSQGVALTKDAVTGNSQDSQQKTRGPQAESKRPRKC